jgi:hypothetical protein
MACHLSDYFNPLSELQREALGFCKYRTVRDLIAAYSHRSLHDLLNESYNDMAELMEHAHEIEDYADGLIARLRTYELYEECAMVKKRTEFYLDQIADLMEGL